MYELQTYGIPTQAIPMDENGDISLVNHLNWLEQRRVQDEMLLKEDGTYRLSHAVLVPRRFDVLLGRGKTASEHSGNLRAFHIVEMNRKRYEQAGKFEKTQIAEKIVHLIQQSYGRFLKKEYAGGKSGEGACWVETSTEEAREKISHCFRRLRELDSKSKATKRKKTLGLQKTFNGSAVENQLLPRAELVATTSSLTSSSGMKRSKSAVS